MKIALTGNPNSGKTTLFNALTGGAERVGNWAGVTVEKKEGKVKKAFLSDGAEVVAVDLPGAYSMSPFTSEENITRNFVKNEAPEVIINIVEATNLSRSLFFTTQLLELGIPMVVALNKSDMTAKKGIVIDTQALSQKLGCPVVETVATSDSKNGFSEMMAAAAQAKGSAQAAPFDAGVVDYTNKEAVQQADKRRFEFVKEIVAATEKRAVDSQKQTKQDKVDKILTNQVVGMLIFAVVMWCVFAISQSWAGPWLADNIVGPAMEFIRNGTEGLMGEGVSPLLRDIVLVGIIDGVGAVLGFLPLIMVMFFLLALLEDCGYMARVAVVMDRIFKLVGLSGKSIIPMVIGIGCAIPGVMATRTIKNVRQRRTTAMLAPFMPCGAKLPVIALFAGAFFADASWVSPLMYFVGIALIILGAIIVLRITGEKDAASFFIIEMPEYKAPSPLRAAISMLSRAKAFIVKAGTIILLCNLAVYMMQEFNWSFQSLSVEGVQGPSILETIATPVAVLLFPLGFGIWQLAAAAVTGFIAKENVVGTLAVVFPLAEFINTEELALIGGAATVVETMGIGTVAALAYLMFNLYTPPCFAAIGAMNAEMENKKWLWGGIAFQFGMGYVVAFLVYQVGTLVTTGALGQGFLPGLVAVAAMIGWVVYLIMKGNKKAEAKLKQAASMG